MTRDRFSQKSVKIIREEIELLAAETARWIDSGVAMKKRPVTLVEMVEHPAHQFWFLFVVTTSLSIALRYPRGEELMWLGGISLLATCGILGVIYFTDHADNPFLNVGLWLKAFVSSLMAFGVTALIAPYAFFFFPVGLMVIPVLQGFVLSLVVDENFGRCFWWSFGGTGLVIGILFVAIWLWSGLLPVLQFGR